VLMQSFVDVLGVTNVIASVGALEQICMPNG
jgi:hypothetical protein